MQKLPDALAPLGAYRQFIAYVLSPRNDGTGKVDKFPVDCRTGKVADAHDPAIWTDAQTALNTVNAWGAPYGVGFVFTEHDPFFFLDVDGCLLPDGSDWSPTAKTLLQWFPGAAVEVSQSGRGLHVFGTGVCPPHGKKNKTFGLEFYTSKRFVALTGTNAVGNASAAFGHVLPQFVAQFFPPGADVDDTDWTDEPAEVWAGPRDDEQLINVALRSSSAAAAFGNKASFRDLWEKNVDVLARVYPETGGKARPFDESQADAALAQHLAFWTGNNCERINRLMKRSALVRDKWEREDYMVRTITRACGLQKNFATGWDNSTTVPQSTPSASHSTSAEAVLVAGTQFMPVDMQREFFAGCVYVLDQHKVWTPDGSLLKSEQFRVKYGGFTFPMDSTNEKVSRNAWEVFTESQAIRFPRVYSTCFRPELPSGAIVEEEGRALLNTYVPIETYALDGDVTPFLTLVGKLWPDERDRRIILTYLAALVQTKGKRKFQWWPVIQGAEGNGKTLIISSIAHAIGNRYTHCPNVAEIAKSGNKFNGWIAGNLFVGMEEVYVADRRNFLEEFKTTVTNKKLPVEFKGVDQVMKDNRAQGIMCTNHKDGVPIGIDTRRYCVFFTAQQSKADIERDGMGGNYFPDLYDWFEGRGKYAEFGTNYGFAIVNAFLQQYQLDEEFNPAGMCQRAPTTSSTAEAIVAGMGSIEQEVLEAVDQGFPGFSGGWVSSMAFDKLLERIGKAKTLPINKRRELLVSLGFDWHPGLKQGRVDNVIAPDGGKPRLFIRQGHISANLTGPAAIARAYSDAQKGAADPKEISKAAQVFAVPPPPATV